MTPCNSLQAISLLLLSLLIGCSPAPVPAAPELVEQPTVELRLIGLVDEASALQQLIRVDNPSLNWQFELGDGQPLLEAVEQGVLDAALVHHIPLSAETLWYNPVALDGLVFIVHPDNLVQDLSLGHIQAIYTGQLSNWADLGGNEGRIEPLMRGRGSGVRELFETRVMGSQRIGVNTEIRPNAATLLTGVANNVNAIGLTTFSHQPDSVRALSINRIVADPAQLTDQQYPLTTPLYWVSRDEPTGEIRGVLAFMQSEAGQDALGGNFGRIR
ncbi:MAG: substrate-binding domain-containing protein [Candidatus Promineifilaceae bacterium]